MRTYKAACKNLNHSKMLVSVQYCSQCGEKFNVNTNVTDCNLALHAERRKNRDSFCYDCGQRLNDAARNINSR